MGLHQRYMQALATMSMRAAAKSTNFTMWYSSYQGVLVICHALQCSLAQLTWSWMTFRAAHELVMQALLPQAGQLLQWAPNQACGFKI